MKILVNNDLTLNFPPINFFLELISNKKYFKFCKINHSFWEMLIGKEPWKSRFLTLHSKDFIQECLYTLKNMSKETMLGIGPNLDYVQKKIEDTPDSTIKLSADPEVIKTIKETIGDRDLFLGTIWKHYTLNNKIDKFFIEIKRNPVVVVGLSHLKNLEYRFGFIHYKINIDADKNKEKILVDLENFRAKFDSPITFLFQAGEILSLWLINNLNLQNANLIDMGRSLDYFCGKIEFSEEDKFIYQKKVKDASDDLVPKTADKERTLDNHFPDKNDQLWQKKVKIYKKLF